MLSRGRFAALVTLIAALVVVADLATPSGVAVGVAYVLLVVCAVFTTGARPVLALGVLATLLAVAAPLMKEARVAPTWVVALNRGLSVLAIWVVVALIVAGQRLNRARAREQQATRTLLSRAIAQSPDGILLVEPSGVVAEANDAAHRILGFPEGELRGRIVEELMPRAERAAHIAHRAAYASNPVQRPMGRMRAVRALRKDGSEIMIEVALAPAGVHEMVVASMRDVTERLRFEERLRGAQRMEAIGRLAGGIAHDFNNLLAVIICCAEFARDAAPEGQRADLEDVLAAARRGAELTGQLLAFSRRQIVAPRRIDVNAHVADAQRMLARILGEDIDLVTKPSASLWSIEIDPSQVEQVLLNLVVNARDAMPDGGKLTIETANVVLDQTYAKEHPDVVPGEYVLLAVSDTGTGMTEEVRQRVFEPFFTTKPTGQGMGLGLATIYGIVKQNGGHVWVYSEPGRGTTFKIYFPRAHGAPEQLAPIREAQRPAGGSERILVVEDEPVVRRVIVRVLRAHGYEVLEAGNGLEALRKLETLGGEVELLLTDVVMPQMGGRELADKALRKYPAMKVLFLSGYTENAIVHRGVLEPSLVFLQKPFTADELARRVRDLLDARSGV
jgi:PAS domain S-box-containing protein